MLYSPPPIPLPRPLHSERYIYILFHETCFFTLRFGGCAGAASQWMAPAEVKLDVELPVDTFWELQELAAFARFTAFNANQVYEVLEESEAPDENGETVVSRVTRLTAINNPVPKSFRSMLGSDEFSYKRTDRWYKGKWDAAHKLTFTVEPPVFPDKIKIEGASWAEAATDATGRVFFTVSVRASIFGIGGRIESEVQGKTANGLNSIPRQILEFAALRKQQPEAFDSAAHIPKGMGSAIARKTYADLARAAFWRRRLRWARGARGALDDGTVLLALAQAVRDAGVAEGLASEDSGGGGLGCFSCAACPCGRSDTKLDHASAPAPAPAPAAPAPAPAPPAPAWVRRLSVAVGTALQALGTRLSAVGAQMRSGASGVRQESASV